MCIFLPNADDGLPSLLDAIASRPGFLHGHLPHEQQRVGEFKLSFHGSVISILRKLGLQLPFSQAADLYGMTEEAELFMNEVIQKAVIEVNEEGTEAAAVTLFNMMDQRAAVRAPPVDVVADHPFAYFIVEEETGAIVFAGHVHDPSRE
jgi:serpin B